MANFVVGCAAIAARNPPVASCLSSSTICACQTLVQVNKALGGSAQAKPYFRACRSFFCFAVGLGASAGSEVLVEGLMMLVKKN